ncbi:tetranectin-like [Nerophis lumbriciformis]|uniref:tetranectin-like n=1 Tax=Nerophis lumbriciformis TaxID=546530 RepID=UPI002ADF3F1E|nr:tetranectin-like [Nerophis lumbriciformis]
MECKGVRTLMLVLLMVTCSLQQTPPKKKPVRKEKDAAIEELQRQINDIVQDLDRLKEEQALQRVCLKGTKITGKCVLADPVKKSYHTASEDCNALGGYLAAPSSADENDQLTKYIQQSVGPGEQVWLGVNDMVTEGTWANQSGDSISFKNWDTSSSRSRQPDGGTSQNCAVLSVAAQGKWSDEKCSDENPSVCQFNIV